jgi:hypothetical protein
LTRKQKSFLPLLIGNSGIRACQGFRQYPEKRAAARAKEDFIYNL